VYSWALGGYGGSAAGGGLGGSPYSYELQAPDQGQTPGGGGAGGEAWYFAHFGSATDEGASGGNGRVIIYF